MPATKATTTIRPKNSLMAPKARSGTSIAANIAAMVEYSGLVVEPFSPRVITKRSSVCFKSLLSRFLSGIDRDWRDVMYVSTSSSVAVGRDLVTLEKERRERSRKKGKVQSKHYYPSYLQLIIGESKRVISLYCSVF